MNEVGITGIVQKTPVINNGQYGQYAFMLVKIDDEGKYKSPFVFVEMSDKFIPMSTVQTITAGQHVLVNGAIKSKQNKKTGAWELIVRAKVVNQVGVRPQTQVAQPVQPQPVLMPTKPAMTEEQQQMEQDINDIFG